MHIKDVKVCTYHLDNSACSWFRIMAPMVIAETQELLKVAQILKTTDLDTMMQFDVILVGRQTSLSYLDDLKTLKAAGKKLILDVDDLLENINKHNPAYDIYSKKFNYLNTFKNTCKLVDGITTTTYELYNNLIQYNDNVHIVNNYVDFGLRNWQYKTRDENDEELTIGWAGSSSHIEDIVMIGNCIKYILLKYPKLTYVHYGDETIYKFLTERYNINPQQINWIKPVPLTHYVENLCEIDIGLAPITDTPFNRAKSALKLMEYSACGIPFIASDVAPYRRYTDIGFDGLLAKPNADAWIENMIYLIENNTIRNQMATNALNKSKQFDMNCHIKEFTNAWEDIINNRKQIPQNNQWFNNVERVGRNEFCPCGSNKKTKKCCLKYL